jgi:hypothetical protein
MMKEDVLYMIRRFFRFQLALPVLLLFTTTLLAQIDTGSIVGLVTDASGAAVAGASVVVTNPATNVKFTTETGAAGQYQVSALIPGRYSVRVSAPGFESALRDGIEITVQARPAVDFTLKAGAAAHTVELTVASPVLQTQSADVGGVYQNQAVVDLPLNGRRYSDLSLLESGIQKNQQVSTGAADRFSSNGNWDTQNYFSLDGVDNNSGSENLQEMSVQVVQPPPDALEEFKIQTRTYSAEFGASAGAVVNVSIKSGTNHWHGDVWEFARNSDMDANTFFNNKDGVPRGHYSQNQAGGTIGGPIIKNRTFFFGDTQFFTSRQAVTTLTVAPTPLMRAGNFTELPFQLSSSPVAGQGGCVANNIVATACIDPVAANILAIWPDANIPGVPSGTPGSWTGLPNYEYVYSEPTDTHSWDFRIDHTINGRNRIFGRFSSMNTNLIGGAFAPWTANPLLGDGDFATQSLISMHGVALAWDRSISPTTLNELRLGFNRDDAKNLPPGLKLGTSAAAQFGLKGIPVTPYTAGLPPIGINGVVVYGPILGIGVSEYHPQFQVSQVQQLADNLGWLKGSHALKFGYEYRRMSDNFLDIQAPQGQMIVNGYYTAGGAFGLPDFELGDVDETILDSDYVAHNYMFGNSLYGQDTWRASRHLTINYGLRYELFSPVLNHQNEQSNFSAANGGGLVTAASNIANSGGLVTAVSNASGWYSRGLVHPDYHNFAPRFGFSYQPSPRLVVRGGYGVFYQHIERTGSEGMLTLNPPELTNDNLSQTLGSSTPVMILKDGFPPLSSAVSLPSLQIRAQDPHERTSYVQQISIGPEIQLSANTSLEITYVGNFARKMSRLRDDNQGIVTGVQNGSPTVVFPWANLNTATQHAFLELATNDGNANYAGLLVSLRRRSVKGLSYGVNYTWSHGISNHVDSLTGTAFPQNAYNYSAEKSNSSFDIRQHFVTFATYQLPVGKGKALLNSGGALSHVVGDWQVNTIVTVNTGTPFDVTAPDMSGTGYGHSDPRPNCISNAHAGTNSNPRIGPLLNFDAFALPSPGSFGNCAPRAFFGPRFANVDLSLFKSVTLPESTRLEFRVEAFNSFNHAQFANPGSAYSPATVGSFGYVTSALTNTNPREIQLALKLYF